MDRVQLRQDLQIGRIFADIKDPNVEVVFVLATEMTIDVRSYYSKVL
jgi:hypothetical protein